MSQAQETEPVREKWKFIGREIIDGVPHLVWAPVKPKTEAGEEVADDDDPASSEEEEAWGCTVEEFREVTTATVPRAA